MNFDPIKPYLNLVKWVAGVMLAVSLFAGGYWVCHRGHGEVNVELATLRKANSDYEKAIEEANKQINANYTLAEQALREAEEASVRARESHRELIIKEQEWTKKFAEAMNDPKCAEVMALEVCALAPLP